MLRLTSKAAMRGASSTIGYLLALAVTSSSWKPRTVSELATWVARTLTEYGGLDDRLELLDGGAKVNEGAWILKLR